MPITVVCPACEARLKARDSAAGKRFKCPKCAQPLLVPGRRPAPGPFTVEHDSVLDILKQYGSATPSSREAEERIFADLAAAGLARKEGNVYVYTGAHLADARFVGRVCCFDGVTRDVYEDPDGRQWVTGDIGRLYGSWLPRGDNQALRAAADERITPQPAATSPARDASPKPVLRGRPLPPDPQARAAGSPPRRPKLKGSDADLVKAILVIGFWICVFGNAISVGFKIALWWGLVWVTALYGCFLLFVFSLALPARFKRKRQALEAERKKREHEAWLRTPQGIASQEEEREKLQRQQEEEERRRKEAEESAARAKWRQYHESKTMADVSRMSGKEFKEFLARLFSRMGYTEVSLTPPNDQGGDLLCLSPSGSRIVIQAKRWTGSVGNSAVQELLGAMRHYGRAEGMVVTNSTFTDAARELAKKGSDIVLRDGRWLEEQIRKFFPPEIPEFNWEVYNRVVKDWQPPRTGGTRKSKSRRYGRRRW
jgi:hypothetical protein